MSRDGPRVAGVDPGTFSFDVCALEGGEVILERSFRTVDVGADPALLVNVEGNLVRPAGNSRLLIYGSVRRKLRHVNARSRKTWSLLSGVAVKTRRMKTPARHGNNSPNEKTRSLTR